MTGATLAVLLAAGTVAETPASAPAEVAATNAAETVVIRTARLRNPFWPIDYLDGEYEAISDGSEAAESSLAVAAAEAEAAERMARRAGVAVDDDAQTQENRWRKASRRVKVSGVTSAYANGVLKSYVSINGRSYARGDRLAVDDDGCRFIWKVQDFDDVGYVKLVRVRYRSLQAQRTDEGGSL